MSIKSLGSVRFKKKINTFIQHGCIKLIKNDSKVTSVSKKYFPLNFLFIKEILKEQNVAWFPQNYEAT